ncbi:hypothetical protein Pfo_002051 [Paulownia fortunei]|nr:hypothetical protein Pfo_002051 [Paulownia fortunei]
MAEGVLQFDVASVVEDVLQQHGKRLSDIDLASRKAEEASLRRYEAAGWLRKMVGVVAGKDLPAQPSEEEFRLGLRSGIILCNVLNKVQPGAVPKVVEAPSDSVSIPDGAALSAYQYFENVRNFLDSIEEMGIPAFEASDLEQGGKSSRIVNCVLALKSYNDWKQGGGKGVWKFGGNSKPPSTGKQFVRKNSDLFMNSLSRNSSTGEKSLDSLSTEQNSFGDLGQDLNEMGTSHSLHILVRELLSDKKREDIPVIVENMLSKVMEEFEHQLASQNEQARTTSRDIGVPSSNKHEEIEILNIMKDRSWSENDFYDDKSKGHALKHQDLVEHQQQSIQELKNTLHATKEDMQMLCMKYQEEVNNLGKHLNGLAHAASGYQKVLEENRKLYNQVQDLKGNIRVYCRVRPFLPGQPTGLSIVEGIDERTLTILTPAKYGKGKKAFTFNKVFGPSASQEEVFSDTQPLIRSVLDGYNVCIFAYGQTGSGKTYTMTGPKELTKESLGVNYRALSDLFLISEQRKDSIAYDVSVQMIEIYNEQVRDLLVTDGLNKRLEIRNNSQNGVNVPNANLVHVTSTSDVINLMNLGHKNRAVGSTALNDRSSRSHSCLTVHVQGRDLTSGSILRGCMHLVDLAGSERADKSEAVGDRLKEAQHINRSLSALGDVISSLAQKNSHVPYRNSKLTQLLQDSLGGQAKTLMFVHISPEPDALGETISTLKFAERVSTVELGAARANKESTDVKELKEQIASLKAALSRKERGESGVQQSRSISPDRVIVRSFGSSPSDSSWQSSGDVSKAEGRSNSSSTSRMQSFDTQDLMDSPPWPPLSSPGSMEEEKCVSGDWVDKVMVKKQGGLSGDNHLGKWDEDGRQLPDMFYQKYGLDTSKVYPEQSLNKISAHRRHSLDNGLARTQYETAATDDSDDLEAETSDSSELDYQWQQNVSRSNCMPNGVGSKVRRPSPKQTKSPEIRSLIPQPPTRRVSNGIHSPLHKHGRQPASIDGKRKPACGK